MTNVRACIAVMFMALCAFTGAANRVAFASHSRQQDSFDAPSLEALGTQDGNDYDFDVFIIGMGSGGIRLGKALAREPLRVGVAENRDWGGTCVNRGCNPKKTLVTATGFINEMQAAMAGGIWDVKASLNWDNLQKKRAAKVHSVSTYYENGIRKNQNVQVFDESAVVAGPHLVKVGGDSYRVKALVVATGGKPRRMNFQGSDLPAVITSDEALDLPKKPRSMLVVGGGYIATELGSFFQQAGVNVSMSIRSKLLKSFDSDVVGIMEDSLTLRGVQLLYGTSVQTVQNEGTDGLVTVSLKGLEDPIRVEYVLLAIGRVPLTAGLGLEENGVTMDRSGKIVVNKYGQTSADWIFAIGDCAAGGPELQPWAVKQADALFEVLLRKTSAPPPTVQPVVPPEHVATALFSTPRSGNTLSRPWYGTVDKCWRSSVRVPWR